MTDLLQNVVLGALCCSERPLTLDELMRDTFVSRYTKSAVRAALAELAQMTFVDFFGCHAHDDTTERVNYWRSTKYGRVRFLAHVAGYQADPRPETKTAASETTAAGDETAAPVSATICNAQETPAPATAILHVGEDELDGWWGTLDVDDKAEAFAYATFGARGDLSVPIAGTLGEVKQ